MIFKYQIGFQIPNIIKCAFVLVVVLDLRLISLLELIERIISHFDSDLWFHLAISVLFVCMYYLHMINSTFISIILYLHCSLHEHCFMHQKRLCPEEMEEFKAKRCVSSMFLQYEDWQWELIYMTQPLRRFKLQATIGVFVLICISIMQSFNTPYVFLK